MPIPPNPDLPTSYQVPGVYTFLSRVGSAPLADNRRILLLGYKTSSGVAVPGTPKRIIGVHPFRLKMSELRIGDTWKTESRTVTLDDIEHFAEFTGDKFYAHMDEEAAKASPIFEGRVAHGYLILSFAAGLFVDPDPGPVLANTGLENLRFLTPLYPGDSIRVELTVRAKSIKSEETGQVRWAVEVFNQKDELVATYDLLTENTP